MTDEEIREAFTYFIASIEGTINNIEDERYMYASFRLGKMHERCRKILEDFIP